MEFVTPIITPVVESLLIEDLKLERMLTLSHVLKCKNWNEFFILHKHQPQSSSFQNLTTVYLAACNKTYLFSPLMAKLLTNLKKVTLKSCEEMEEIVSSIDDEDNEAMISAHTTTTLFPQLDILELDSMYSLGQIGGGVAKAPTHGQSKEDVVRWSLSEYTRKIDIFWCHDLISVIPCYAAARMQKLQVLSVRSCSSVEEVFETKEANNDIIAGGSRSSSMAVVIPRPTNTTAHRFPNLKKLEIVGCNRLEYIITFSILESLKKLETLRITYCHKMKLIVKDEEKDVDDVTVRELKLSCLKSLTLNQLSSLEGFCLGKGDFSLPGLDTLEIKKCPQITFFTRGRLFTPKLRVVETSSGSLDVEEDINSFITTKKQEGYKF